MKKILSLAGIYLLCRLVHFSLIHLLPLHFPGHVFLPKAAFFLLALLLASKLVMKVSLSYARLLSFTLLACFVDELGAVIGYIAKSPLAAFLFFLGAWTLLLLLLYRKDLSWSEAALSGAFLSPKALAVALLLLAASIAAYWDYFDFSMSTFPLVGDFLSYVDLMTGPVWPDLFLPQFAFFSWALLCIEHIQGKTKSK